MTVSGLPSADTDCEEGKEGRKFKQDSVGGPESVVILEHARFPLRLRERSLTPLASSSDSQTLLLGLRGLRAGRV